MNDLLIKIFIGFMYRWRGSTFVQCELCDVNMMTGFLTANCSNLPTQDVPQDIDPKIEFLILSNNTFVRLNESSFGRYKNLILLSLENTAYLDLVDPINYYTFRPLINLEMLIMNEIHTPFNLTFYWPSSLRLISINYDAYISDMDFSALKKLQDVHARTDTVRTFPKFHRQSPLTFLDFRGNPMDSLTAEDLAPFCILDYLSLEWPENAVINGSERYCQCLRLEKWIKMSNIDVNGPLNCTPPVDIDAEPCNLDYSENTLLLRRECINRINRPNLSAWFWIGLSIVLFTPLMIVTFRETRTHRKFSETPTTSTRNPKYANVKLRINVDEDFEDEDESELVESEQENDEENEGNVLPVVSTSPKMFTKESSSKFKEHIEENVTTPTRKPNKISHSDEKSPGSKSPNVSPDISSPSNYSNKEIRESSPSKESPLEGNLSPDLSSHIDSSKEKELKKQINQLSPLKEDDSKEDVREEESKENSKEEDSGENVKKEESKENSKKEDSRENVKIEDSKGNVSPNFSERSSLSEDLSPRKEDSENVTKKSPDKPENQSPKPKEQASMISSPVNASRQIDLMEEYPTFTEPRDQQPIFAEPQPDTEEEYPKTKYQYQSPVRSRYNSPKRYRSVETSPLEKIPITFDLMEEIEERPVIKEFKTPKKESSLGAMYENPISPECYSLKEYNSLEDMNEHHRKTDDQLSITSPSQEEIARLRKMAKSSHERRESRSS